MSPESTTREYTVTSMTCSHCALSVQEEVSEVEGVDAVDVQLESGCLTVAGQGFQDAAIQAAVKEAGYGLER